MKGLEEKLICFLETNQAISEEDREIYSYALKCAGILGGHIITSILIGFWLRVPWYCLLLLTAIILLRSDAGGYHAETAGRCYILSCTVLIAALLWMKADVPFRTVVTVCAAIPFFLLIFRNAPLDSENKPLTVEEKKKIGRRARVIVMAEMISGLVCIPFDEKAACILLSAIISCGVGYIGWFIKNRKKQTGM